MKRILQLSILMAFSLSYGQRTLPLYEGFNYIAGTNVIGQGDWTNASTSTVTNDALIATSPVWGNNGLPTAAGEALAISRAGDDPQLAFAPAPQSGSLYSSFVMKVTSLMTGTVATPSYITSGTSTASGPAPSFFFSFAFFNTGTSSTSYAGSVFIRRDNSTDTDKFRLGIGASNTVAVDADVVWSPTVFTIGDEIVVVTKYDIDNKVAKMWINPTISSTEPADQVVSGVRTGSIKPDRLRLNKNSAATTPYMIIDEIRGANNWGEVVGGASTLGLSKSEIAQLKVYPNPVSNGTLNISSANNSEKEVAIYNILGQKVFQTQTTSGAINVSSLGKGGYLLKITEDGKSETKKLIVQ
ncbi:T9SS type A sorting domain-containing protein [Flavobacterium sp. WC2509]|uniref:T9SS type A sorting domain-containing protein n=1 Tax=Flavobacterium sp. WC2509 TaxID=3461406 RepID=UPI004044B13E